MNEKVLFLKQWLNALSAEDRLAVIQFLTGNQIERRGLYGGPPAGMINLNEGLFGGPAPSNPASSNACPTCKRPY